ncbi:hypothetical protein QYF61_015879 [Mycteria americana]|uniref:Uncharacterized protein n=1 Tax=Mycteria americana TaxID=33587 RepID=A0AAN7PJW8_MYCAM|nr:hypothetical protein QYF61_015879 [Mycteria americana]
MENRQPQPPRESLISLAWYVPPRSRFPFTPTHHRRNFTFTDKLGPDKIQDLDSCSTSCLTFPCPQLSQFSAVSDLLAPRSCSTVESPKYAPGMAKPHSQSHEGNSGWRLNHFPGQPVPMLDNPFSEVKFPNIQSKPPLVQLEAISSCPITCYLGEETDPHLSTTSCQAKQPQFPQPLLVRLVLQTLHQLRCPSLDTLQPLNVSLVVGGPKLNTVVEVQPRQCRAQGEDCFPSPAGHTIFDTSQDAVGFLGHLGTLLAHIQAAVNQHPQVLLCWAAFQPLFPKPVALHGVTVAQVQDLALGLVKPHTIGPSPSIQPVQVPLQSFPTLKQINTPAQLGVICKLTEGALDPFIQIIDKDVKQNWPQHRALRNTTCDRPPTGVNSIHHQSLGPAIQPVLYPAKSENSNGSGAQPQPGFIPHTAPLHADFYRCFNASPRWAPGVFGARLAMLLKRHCGSGEFNSWR